MCVEILLLLSANTHPMTQTTLKINVTNMTPRQKRKLFTRSIGQTGFTSFIKTQEKNQTYFVFHYDDFTQDCQVSTSFA
jgi:hypothetical protein